MSTTHEAVVIGTSAGAVQTLSQLLPELPATFALPIMVVVHLPADKKSVLPELLQSKCKLRVKEAEDKEPIMAGTIYIAPPDYHLLVEKKRILSLSSEEQQLFSRPSIDVLFETAADAYGDSLLGIVLTGANNDGSHGLALVCAAGGTAIVQDPEAAYASAMPLAALKACPSAHALTITQIAQYLQKAVTP